MSLTKPIILGLIVVIINVIMSIVFKETPKVDKGFKVFYFELSHRRKMIRSLIVSPVILIIALTAIYYFTTFSMTENVLLGLLFFVLFMGEASYNFYMWKKGEN